MLNSIFGKRKEKSGSEGSLPPPPESAPAVDVTTNYQDFDADYYQKVEAGVAGATDRSFSCSFWPPVQCGKFISSMAPVEFKCLEFVVEDNDVMGFVKTSEVYRSMSHLGIEAKLSKASCKDNSIYLGVDNLICGTNNSYDIQVGNGRIVVIGADKTGLLYGLYSLLQLFRLYAEVRTDAAGPPSLVVPAAVLSNRADVAERAVLWSFRQQVRASTARMHEQIELLSRLHMNSIYLVIDEPIGIATDAAALEEFLKFASTYQISVTPTIVVSSIHQG